MRSLIIFLALVATAAVIGSQFEPGAWYEALVKAPWTPPNWLFAPAWTMLYIAIAFAGWRVWRKQSTRSRVAMVAWFAQLILNALWSWLFFGLHRPDLALVDIIALLICIALFIRQTWGLDRAAAWLFLPYAIWVSYALSLNLYIWLYN